MSLYVDSSLPLWGPGWLCHQHTWWWKWQNVEGQQCLGQQSPSWPVIAGWMSLFVFGNDDKGVMMDSFNACGTSATLRDWLTLSMYTHPNCSAQAFRILVTLCQNLMGVTCCAPHGVELETCIETVRGSISDLRAVSVLLVVCDRLDNLPRTPYVKICCHINVGYLSQG